jgi:hypothetical protein
MLSVPISRVAVLSGGNHADAGYALLLGKQPDGAYVILSGFLPGGSRSNLQGKT